MTSQVVNFEALQYGLIGLGFLLAMLSFGLLVNEQRKLKPRKEMFRPIYIFMAFSCVVLIIGFFSEASRKSRTLSGKVIPEARFEGQWSVTGEDLDFPETQFVARNTYTGEVQVSVSGSILSFTGDLETYHKHDNKLGGVGRWVGQGQISDKNQVSGYYDYTNNSVGGFGTVFMQFDDAGKEVVGYLVFRVTKASDGTIGQARLRMTRK